MPTVFTTSTVTGFVGPNFALSSSWIVALFVMFVGIMMMNGFAYGKVSQESAVVINLLGLLFGVIFGALFNAVPVALPFVFGFLFAVYLWKGRG